MIALTRRRLQVFSAIVETGSFAGAARRLGIAQPSVSAHVRAMEAEIGGALFERRSGRQAALTELGRSLIDHARDMLASASRLEAHLGARTEAAQRVVTFACQRSIAHTALRAPLADYVRNHRDVRLSIRVAFQEEVVAAVRMGAADIGCLLSNAEPDGASSVVVGRQRFVVFARSDHPLAGRSRVAPADVGACDFVGPAPTSLFGQAQRRMLAGLGIDRVNTVAEATEFGPVRDLVEAGVGLGCSLLASVAPDLATGRLALIDIEGPPLLIDVRMLIDPRRRDAPAVRSFADHLRASLSAASDMYT